MTFTEGKSEALLKSEGWTPPEISIPYFYPSELGSQNFVGREDELQLLHVLNNLTRAL